MSYRGTVPTYTRDMGITPTARRGQNSIPNRQISQARMAELGYSKDMYANIHSNPSEQLELYSNQKQNRQELLNNLYKSKNKKTPIADDMIETYLYFNEGRLNDYVGSPRPGESLSSPRVVLVNSLGRNRPQDYTGFRWGSNLTKAKYDIDYPGFGGSDEVYRDLFPELIENIPRTNIEDLQPDDLEIKTDLMHKRGEFNYPNRIELLNNNRYPYNPGNTYYRHRRNRR